MLEIKIFMFIVTLFTFELQLFTHFFVIRDFKGPKVQNFDLPYHKMEKKKLKSNIKEKMLKINFLITICNYIFVT